MTCHKEISPGIYHQWFVSSHALHGVTCYDCHQAQEGDDDSFTHWGALIATLVTPRDCGRCHRGEAEEVGSSHHAEAGQILESNDAYLAHIAGGTPVAVVGCESCHGTKIEIDLDAPNRLAQGSLPNSGIGRINPDGSLGSCSACHTRHGFSRAQARQPEACGKCHLGPDHPQKEVYEESKHGIAYYTNVDRMNLDADRWVVGRDYFTAPTCATCHMSATRKQRATHDVGERISWTLRPPVSVLNEDWKRKRADMQDVCSACHSPAFYRGHYRQFDGLVNLYNEKFAKPAAAVMEILHRDSSLASPAAFSNDIEWIYWELWHHEGRRARHGASMMGPDYAWWHGIYEVAQHFYFKFIPAVRGLDDPEAAAYLERMLLEDPMHNWMSRRTADLKRDIRTGKIEKIYENFYLPEMK